MFHGTNLFLAILVLKYNIETTGANPINKICVKLTHFFVIIVQIDKVFEVMKRPSLKSFSKSILIFSDSGPNVIKLFLSVIYKFS